jgi:hypothetical protein
VLISGYSSYTLNLLAVWDASSCYSFYEELAPDDASFFVVLQKWGDVHAR